jgi:hypothetical protein
LFKQLLNIRDGYGGNRSVKEGRRKNERNAFLCNSRIARKEQRNRNEEVFQAKDFER